MVTFLCRLPLAKSHMAHLVGKGVIPHTLLKHVLQATGARTTKMAGERRQSQPQKAGCSPRPIGTVRVPRRPWSCAWLHDPLAALFFFSSWLLFLFYFQLQNISLLRKKKKQNYPFFYAELTVWDFAGKDGSYLISSGGCLHGEEFSCPQWRSWCTCLYCNTLLWFNLTLKGCVWEELYWSTSLFVGANWIWGI